jgi:hypothetical protein
MKDQQHVVFFSKKRLVDQNKFHVLSCFVNLKFFFVKLNFITDAQFFVKKHFFSNHVNEIVFYGSTH